MYKYNTIEISYEVQVYRTKCTMKFAMIDIVQFYIHI